MEPSAVAPLALLPRLHIPPSHVHVIGVLAQSAGLLNALWLIAALFITAFGVAGALRPRPAPRPDGPGRAAPP